VYLFTEDSILDFESLGIIGFEGFSFTEIGLVTGITGAATVSLDNPAAGTKYAYDFVSLSDGLELLELVSEPSGVLIPTLQDSTFTVSASILNLFQAEAVEVFSVTYGFGFAGVQTDDGTLLSEMLDEQAYLNANPDVAEAVASGVFVSGLQHWELHGIFEDRDGSLLDVDFYLNNNEDVADAVEAGGFESGLSHYLSFGRYEGRAPGILAQPATVMEPPVDLNPMPPVMEPTLV